MRGLGREDCRFRWHCWSLGLISLRVKILVFSVLINCSLIELGNHTLSLLMNMKLTVPLHRLERKYCNTRKVLRTHEVRYILNSWKFCLMAKHIERLVKQPFLIIILLKFDVFTFLLYLSCRNIHALTGNFFTFHTECCASLYHYLRWNIDTPLFQMSPINESCLTNVRRVQCTLLYSFSSKYQALLRGSITLPSRVFFIIIV